MANKVTPQSHFVKLFFHSATADQCTGKPSNDEKKLDESTCIMFLPATDDNDLVRSHVLEAFTDE
jgi:hypothetical protein